MQGLKVAVCALRQQALDFSGNLENILESLGQSRANGAMIRCGPDLEIS